MQKYLGEKRAPWMIALQEYDLEIKPSTVDKDETEVIFKELHFDLAGGHFGGENTAHKILRAGYYWPTLFQDSYAFFNKYQECQLSCRKS